MFQNKDSSATVLSLLLSWVHKKLCKIYLDINARDWLECEGVGSGEMQTTVLNNKIIKKMKNKCQRKHAMAFIPRYLGKYGLFLKILQFY